MFVHFSFIFRSFVVHLSFIFRSFFVHFSFIFRSLSFIVVHCRSLSFIVVHFLSLSYIVLHCLSFSFIVFHCFFLFFFLFFFFPGCSIFFASTASRFPIKGLMYVKKPFFGPSRGGGEVSHGPLFSFFSSFLLFYRSLSFFFFFFFVPSSVALITITVVTCWLSVGHRLVLSPLFPDSVPSQSPSRVAPLFS